MPPGEQTDSPNRVLTLVSDSGNDQLLTNWIENHPSHELAVFSGDIGRTEFDVCILDGGAFREHLEALRAKKRATAPVLLPYLLLLGESDTGIIDTDAGQLADNVVTETIDELVTLPIQQAELHWRLVALLRLREQSLTLRQRERELERQVDLFEKAQDIANVGAWEYDIRAEEWYWTDEVYRIYALPRDTTPSREASLQQYHPDDRPTIEEAFTAAVEEGEPYDLELRLLDAEGTLRWVQTRCQPKYDDGTLTRVRGTIRDITERRQREDRLQRRSRGIDKAPVGISFSDPDRDDNPLIYVNDAFLTMTGYSREEVIGENCRFLQGEHTDPDRVARIRAAIDAQESASVDFRNYRKDGIEFWNHLEIAPVRNEDGEVVNWIGFQQDITERKRRQEQLEIIDRVLRHNLRNDMNAIRGHARTIHSDTSGETAVSAESIVDTSNQLLELAEKEQQITETLQEEPIRTEIAVDELLEQAVSTVRPEYPEATIAVDCPDDVPVRVTTQFEKAIEELVTNAIVHNDSPSPEVEITVTRVDGAVRIEIADTGPRIAEMERSILVDDEERTPLYHGSSLGLWLVKLLTSRAGGTIAFEENSPTGNIVTIELQE